MSHPRPMPRVLTVRGAEITALLAQYHSAPSIKLRDQIIVANDRLATQAASKAAKIQATPYPDLLQIARVGLIKAVERFNPSLGYSFSSYAIPIINGELSHHRDRSPDPHTGCKRNQTNAPLYSRVLTRHRKWLSLGINRPRSDAALSLGIPLKRWEEIAAERARQNPIALDCIAEAPQLEAETVGAFSPVTAALQRLPALVILACVRHFIEERTVEDIALELGQSIETVQKNIQIGRERIAYECLGSTANF